MKKVWFLILGLAGVAVSAAVPPWYQAAEPRLVAGLVERHGEAQRARAARGLRQVAERWRTADGDEAVFAAFVAANFAGDAATLDALFARWERRLEVLDGHFAEMGYEFRLHADLDRGPMLPFDEAFAAYAPGAHVSDDLFANKLAFTVLLNFPLSTLEQRLAEGGRWTRRQWAEARLADRFAERVPAAIQQARSAAQSAAELYVNGYRIRADRLVDAEGRRLFPAGLSLSSHWNLRDEIKAQYARGAEGLAAQRQLQRVMERIVDQTIPQVVLNNAAVDWDPETNRVAAAAAGAPAPDAAREPDTRYARWLDVFRANRAADPYYPEAPNFIARRFATDRQMSEARVRGMLEAVLGAPEFAQVGALIARRLGRPLEPFDLWYGGFRPQAAYPEDQLDALCRRRFPDAAAFRADLPAILGRLGFAPDRAAYLQGLIDVEAARGTGHAMPGSMRGGKARLRTHVGAGGMDYKGFNIAIHELGHNIEQTFSLNDVDHVLLRGVPNNAFTEALAMVLQGRDLEVLGLAGPDGRRTALEALEAFWATAEISGVALVDIDAWHWLYAHPEATPAEFRAAVLEIARDTWNRWYAPVFGRRDVTLLAIYSHLIYVELYVPDYPIGHLIGHQIEEQMRKAGRFGDEFERMCRLGNVSPDLWMEHATGAPVGEGALRRATQAALAELAADR